MVNDGGIVTTLKPETGEVIQQGRLKGAIDRYYASPVAADGKIYMASEKGKVVVLKPDGNLDPMVVNDLQDDIYATPALVDGRIYLRTRQHAVLLRVVRTIRRDQRRHKRSRDQEL